MNKSKVYFTKDITPSSLVEMYKAVGKELTGKVAVKVHSGEKGNQNYLLLGIVIMLLLETYTITLNC